MPEKKNTTSAKKSRALEQDGWSVSVGSVEQVSASVGSVFLASVLEAQKLSKELQFATVPLLALCPKPVSEGDEEKVVAVK